jgi:hypothetical protein
LLSPDRSGRPCAAREEGGIILQRLQFRRRHLRLGVLGEPVDEQARTASAKARSVRKLRDGGHFRVRSVRTEMAKVREKRRVMG